MAYKKGQCGNPNGRPKGAVGKRAQLAKQLEPHAKELIQKMIELALGGDVTALRLCIERLIPKVQRAPIPIILPSEFTPENVANLNEELLQAVFEGQLSIEDAERLIALIDKRTIKTVETYLGNDPVEAARVYQQFIRNI